MNTTLLNNHTKFRAKIFTRFHVITFYVLGHFFSRTLYKGHHGLSAIPCDSLRRPLRITPDTLDFPTGPGKSWKTSLVLVCPENSTLK